MEPMMKNSLISLAKQVGNQLKEKELVLVTAESCTGGWVAQTITAIPGSSAWFDRGFVTYSDQSKQQMLAVPAKVIQEFGAVSEEVVRAMANGALAQSDGNISLAITGIAGPTGATKDKPVGTCWFAWASKYFDTITRQQCFKGDRAQVRSQAVEYALSELKAIISKQVL